MFRKLRFANLAKVALVAVALCQASPNAYSQAPGPNPLYWIGLVPEEGGIGSSDVVQWSDATHWSESATGESVNNRLPTLADTTIFGQALPTVTGGVISPKIDFWSPGSANVVQFQGSESFTFRRPEVDPQALNVGSTIRNIGSGQQTFEVDVLFNGTSGHLIENSGTGGLLFQNLVSTSGPLGILINDGSIEFDSITATSLDIVNENGSLRFSDGLDLGGDSSITWDLANADEIFVSSLTNANNFELNLDLSGYDSLDAISELRWDIFVLASGTYNVANLTSNIVVSGLEGADGLFSWGVENNTIYLQAAAVPEPSTVILLGVAGAIGGVVARRRSKKVNTCTESPASIA